MVEYIVEYILTIHASSGKVVRSYSRFEDLEQALELLDSLRDIQFSCTKTIHIDHGVTIDSSYFDDRGGVSV